MSRREVPAPPVASFEKKPASRPSLRETKRHAVLLDEAFLRRVYRANCWFALVLALWAGLVANHLGAALSSGLGSLTGILFLKTQELFVERWLRSKTGKPVPASWRNVPTWVLVPGKYAVLIATILLLRRAGLMNYLTFVGGCLTVQLIMLTMAMGRMVSRRSTDGKAATMLHEVYVAPHKVKK